MRHRVAGRKLSRSSSHRRALMRTMVTDLLEHERMITTLPKAKELRSAAEKMITLGKRESLHARRQALSFLRRKSVVHKLFDTLGPRYADREGGYTRILKLGFRRGDAAEVALVELVEEEIQRKPKRKKRKKKPAPAAAAAAPVVEEAASEEAEVEAPAEQAAPEEAKTEAEAVEEAPAEEAAAAEAPPEEAAAEEAASEEADQEDGSEDDSPADEAAEEDGEDKKA